jgi:L-ascorbate metabolism protein UlaG (beta-lactamase superfamily)
MQKLVSLAAASFAVALMAGCASPPESVAPAPRAAAVGQPAAGGKTEVLWLGHAATRITTPGGKVIVIDPWLTSNPKTPAAFKQLQALGKVDLILISHAHFDHFADVPALAKLHNIQVFGPNGLGATMAALGILPAEQAQRFNKGGSISPLGPNGPKITAVRAEHSSELNWKDAAGKDHVHPGGEPLGFIIEMENGFKVWHMGDTAIFGDMRLIADIHRPDLVLVPIGGHFTMGPQDAALAMREMVRPRFAIPVHYGTSPTLRGTPAEFKAALGNSPIHMLAVEPGQKVDF